MYNKKEFLQSVMNIIFYGKNVKMTESMQSFISTKAASLSTLLRRPSDASMKVTAVVEKDGQIADISVTADGRQFTASAKRRSFYDAFTAAVEKLKRQLASSGDRSITALREKGEEDAAEDAPLGYGDEEEMCGEDEYEDEIPGGEEEFGEWEDDDEPSGPVCRFWFEDEASKERSCLVIGIDLDDAAWLRDAYEKWKEFCSIMGISEKCLRDVQVEGAEEGRADARSLL